MASELIVQTLKGPTSGANANKVIIPSGQTLDASAGGLTTPSGHVIQTVVTTSNTQYSGTNSGVLTYLFQVALTPKYNNSKYLVTLNLSGIGNGGSGRLALRVRHNETSGDTSGTQLMDCQLANAGAGTSDLAGGATTVLVNSSGNTNTQYFKVCAYKNDTSTTWYVSQYNSYCSIHVQEIAG